jgi:hypothetical protein
VLLNAQRESLQCPHSTRSGNSQWQQKALVAQLQFPLEKADYSNSIIINGIRNFHGN